MPKTYSTFISALGWIPYVSRWGHLRNSAYAKYADASAKPRQTRFLIHGMFKTGNRIPPESIFVDKSRFEAYLGKREYRGAACLQLQVEADGRRISVSGDALDAFLQVGYTPFPLPWELFWLRRFLPTCRGDAEAGFGTDPSYKYDSQRGLLAVHLQVKFRIGRMMRVALLGLTGHDAPYVWMRLLCVVDFKHSRVMVRAYGTSVPSQWYRWVPTENNAVLRVKTHDMIWINLKGVLDAVACKTPTAPRYFRSKWLMTKLQ